MSKYSSRGCGKLSHPVRFEVFAGLTVKIEQSIHSVHFTPKYSGVHCDDQFSKLNIRFNSLAENIRQGDWAKSV
jgi:hypothetical protein